MMVFRTFKHIFLLFLLNTIGFSTHAQLQISSEGLPPIRHFTTDDFPGHTQNWAIIQDDRGLIYAANTEGILEFDGEKWRQLAGGVTVLAFDKSTSGNIYYGGAGDFGFLEPNNEGVMNMTSLRELHLNETQAGTILFVLSSGTEIYFIGYNTIYIYNEVTKLLKVVNSENRMYPAFLFNDQLHLKLKKGLFKLNGDILEPAEHSQYFENNQMVDVLTFGSDSAITIGRTGGAHFYSKDTAYKVSYFDHPFFRKNGFYKSIRLSSDYYVLCFLKGGVVIVDKNWQPVLHLDEEVGFENQTHNAFEDQEGNLWFATNAGISQIEITSPVSTFSELNGLKTAVYNVLEYQGEIFATGSAGVFHKPKVKGFELLEKGTKSFREIENSQITGVELLTNQSTLFSIHTSVSGEINNHKFNQLFPNEAYMASGTFASDSLTIVTTSNVTNGIEIFKQEGNRWVHKKTQSAKGLPNEYLSRMEFDKNTHKIWGCNQQGELISFSFSEAASGIQNIQRYDSSHLVPDAVMNIFKLGNEVRIFSRSGLYLFSEEDQKFIKDVRFSDYFDEIGILYMAQQDVNTFWYTAVNGEKGKLIYDPESKKISVESRFFKPFGMKSSGNVYFGENSGVMIPSMKGMLIVDPDKSESYDFHSSPVIRKIDVISTKDSTVFNGIFFNQDSSYSFKQENSVNFDESENAFRFTYAIPYFKGGGNIEYQFKLEGFSENWSSWSKKNEKEYTNIPPGPYQFLVKAKNVYGVESETTSFNFSIATPWYLTISAYVFYFTILIFVIWVIVRLNARRLKRENEKLENIILERTSEIRSQAEQLQKLDNAKSRFFANISHELRTPLTLIQGPLESIVDGSSGKINNTVRSNIDLSRNNTKKLLGLVDEILDLSKLEAGKLELKLVSVKLYDFISRIFFTYQSSTEAKKVTLNLDYKLEKAAIFMVDSGKLEKILDNLLSNAVKFTDAGGEIKMQVEAVKEQLNIKISDNGIGIDKSEIDQIFDRFYQAGKENKYAGGTGIGLALAKELATLLNGDLELESDLGIGTTLTLTIPLIAGAQNELEIESDTVDNFELQETEENNDDPSRYKDIRILIVEDNEMMRAYVRKQMQDQYLVDEAEDGIEALDMIKSNDYDLIITDLMMPRLDGHDLVAKLRETEDVSIIMLTARAADEDIVQGLNIGVDDYITKPFNPRELKARVRNILNNRQSRSELESDAKEISFDDKQIMALKEIILANLNKSTFNVSVVADKISLSERQLSRNIKRITGLTAGNFIKEVRLNEARIMLENKSYNTISEICYAVGFEKPGYFSEIYTKRFGKRPADYFA